MAPRATSSLHDLTGEAAASRRPASSHRRPDPLIDAETLRARDDRPRLDALEADEPAESAIGRLMQKKHRQCLDAFSMSEALVLRNDWGKARNAFDHFRHAMKLHLSLEEDVLLPSLDQRVAFESTATIRMEHVRLRLLLSDMEEAIAEEDRDLYLRFSQALRIALQQHTKAEEVLLSALSAAAFGGEADEIIRRMKSL